MDEEPPNDELDELSEESSTHYPIRYVESMFDYTPRVDLPLDLFIDSDKGVIVGRSSSFHKKYKKIGLGLIGAIAETSDELGTAMTGLPVNLDLVSPHVLFVAGKRGSGKSYTLGIIFEELARAISRNEIEVAAVVIDTVDVFRQSVEPNLDQTDLLKKWNLESTGFPVAVYIPKRTFRALPEDVKEKANLHPLAISPRELSSSEWGYILEKGGELSTTMENLVGDVVDSLKRGYTLADGGRITPNNDYSIRNMIECIESNPTITDFYKLSTRTAMIQRLRSAQRLGVFHPGGTSAQELAVAGQVTIIDVAPLGSDAETVLAILTNMLCRQVLTYRMAWTDEGTSAREELPPTWLIIDEAHTLVPRSGDTPAKNAIVGYAKLGRRFGCSLVLCTQQPSAVSDDAISQADIIISHSLSHDGDIRALQQRAPAVMPELFRDKVFISSLPRGVALLFDQSTENKRGFIMQVRPRLSQHGGTDRLSGVLEAATLFATDHDESIQEDTLPLPEEDLEDDSEISDHESLPKVPKPPIHLSKSDWDALDEWIKEYIKVKFDQDYQEYTITEEPAPHLDSIISDSDVIILPDKSPEFSESVIDAERIKYAQFNKLHSSLLAKAMTRIVLYSPPAHDFLFYSNKLHREVIQVQKQGRHPIDLIHLIANAFNEHGFAIQDYVDYESFTFVFLTKNHIRAAFAVGVCDNVVTAPIVMMGPNSAEVSKSAVEIEHFLRS
jgi:hypothetical protein